VLGFSAVTVGYRMGGSMRCHLEGVGCPPFEEAAHTLLPPDRGKGIAHTSQGEGVRV